jgi:hypothetical protein
MQASAQWSSRPSDERFTSLEDMRWHFAQQRAASREVVVASRKLQAVPIDHRALQITGPNGNGYAPTHHAFGQLAQLAQAPAGYLRTLPAPMAADLLNYGFQVARDVQDVGVLLYKNGTPVLRAATGPKYGRIWNQTIVDALVRNYGDGVTGRYRVPGEFGRAVEVTKQNTTLFAGDRDMFVFLADEQNRIELPNRRDGKTGTLARGFFVWNSEVGAATFGLKAFLFDYVCCNRIVWGAQNIEEVRIRHTASAPDRFIEEIQPALNAYANSSTDSLRKTITDARAQRIADVDVFLSKRFGPRMVEAIKVAHLADEGRPIETVWDAVTGVTAHARTIEYQDARVELETAAGALLAA